MARPEEFAADNFSRVVRSNPADPSIVDFMRPDGSWSFNFEEAQKFAPSEFADARAIVDGYTKANPSGFYSTWSFPRHLRERDPQPKRRA